MAALVPFSYAQLPETYKAAKTALEKCVRIDECKNWSDRAEALASYARQRKDESLHKMADRIRARATDQCGKLLRELASAKTGPKQLKGGAPLKSPREQAAANAGLSKDQAKAALQVNNVPRDQFEALVESDNPPTITALAKMGTKPRPKPLIDLGERTPAEFAEATTLLGLVERIAEDGVEIDLPKALRGCAKHEMTDLMADLRAARQWLAKVDKTARSKTWHARPTSKPPSASLKKKSTTSSTRGSTKARQR